MKYLIWSMEHDGWYKDDGMGRTRYLGAAGAYDHDRALSIVLEANSGQIGEVSACLVPLAGGMLEWFQRAVFEFEAGEDMGPSVETQSLMDLI